MPVQYTIDEIAKRVTARAYGLLSAADVFGYQGDVWSRADLAGYDELFDLSEVTELEKPEVYRIQKLAELASQTVSGPEGNIALVAPGDQLYGLARMYQTYRNMTASRPKEIGVFRTRGDAEAFLVTQAAQQD
jgi:hypothetical protein